MSGNWKTDMTQRDNIKWFNPLKVGLVCSICLSGQEQANVNINNLIFILIIPKTSATNSQFYYGFAP